MKVKLHGMNSFLFKTTFELRVYGNLGVRLRNRGFPVLIKKSIKYIVISTKNHVKQFLAQYFFLYLYLSLDFEN